MWVKTAATVAVAGGLAVGSVTPALAVAAQAAPPAAVAAAGPTRFDLPTGFRPEGITTAHGLGVFFAGSMVDGRIVRGNLRTGVVEGFTPGVAGRALRGMVYDGRTKTVWTVGSEGSAGLVLGVDARTGAVLHTYVIPDANFLNDLTLTKNALWVTDSGIDRLTRVELAANGDPTGALTFLPLTGAWPIGSEPRANGIRALADGTLLLNNCLVGGLWRVDPTSGVVTAVPIEGGTLTAGDGLELVGHTAYVVGGNDIDSISVLTIDYGPHGAVTATWRGLLSGGLDYASTASRDGKDLYVINARFSNPDPLTAAYWVTKLPVTKK